MSDKSALKYNALIKCLMSTFVLLLLLTSCSNSTQKEVAEQPKKEKTAAEIKAEEQKLIRDTRERKETIAYLKDITKIINDMAEFYVNFDNLFNRLSDNPNLVTSSSYYDELIDVKGFSGYVENEIDELFVPYKFNDINVEIIDMNTKNTFAGEMFVDGYLESDYLKIVEAKEAMDEVKDSAQNILLAVLEKQAEFKESIE